jgi:hypothetical protein
MLKCKYHAKWEEAEQDELRSFHLCNVLSKTPHILETTTTQMDLQIEERPQKHHLAT